MKLYKKVITLLIVIINCTTVVAPTNALNKKILDVYSKNNIIFYDPDGGKKNCFTNGRVGVLAGNDNAEKIWNYFATANIPGVSDNAAAIAGIIGNFMQESSMNPFKHTGGSQYYGIYQTNAPGLLNAIENAGLSQYWGSESAPQDAVDEAISIQLNFLTQENPRFLQSGENYSFLNNLETITEKTPEAYADLFLVAVEGAVTDKTIDNNYIKDSGARQIGTSYFSGAKGGGQYYQEAGHRRNYAREIFDKYAGTSITSLANTQTGGGGKFEWNDGWLTSGIPGIEIQNEVDNPIIGEMLGDYTTQNKKPNKIVLHSTEGTSNGFDAYGKDNNGKKYPAHFIVDLREKQGYQNLPINQRSAATKASDGSSVQIEIVGWSKKEKEGSKYYLQGDGFGEEEWDYLAVLLAAIAQETNIPLTTSVSWDNSAGEDSVRSTMSESDFNNSVTGIVGHMHSPRPDNHSDPGNIWPMVEAAIARNPDAAKFADGSYSSCLDNGKISGGLTIDQAKTFMENYYDDTKLKASDYQLTCPDGCESTPKCNCVSLSKFFIQAFTTLGKIDRSRTGDGRWGDGVDFVYKLGNELNIKTGSEPHVFSIFSVDTFNDSGTRLNHTGVVVSIDGDKITTIEAAYNNCSMTRVNTHTKEYFHNGKHGDQYTFAYLDDIIDESAIMEFINK